MNFAERHKAIDQFDSLNYAGKNFVIQFMLYVSYNTIEDIINRDNGFWFEFILDHFKLKTTVIKQLLNNNILLVINNGLDVTLLIVELKEKH